MAPKYYNKMDREELIEYCDFHSETERALFHKDMIAQIIDYAGCPEDWPTPDKIANGNVAWYSMHEDMKGLVKLAEENEQS